MLFSLKETVYNFVVGGVVAVGLLAFLRAFREKNSAEFTGFTYGAPLLLPYIAAMAYFHTGPENIPRFARHCLIGMSTSVPMIIAMMFIRNIVVLIVGGLSYLLCVFLFYAIAMYAPSSPS